MSLTETMHPHLSAHTSSSGRVCKTTDKYSNCLEWHITSLIPQLRPNYLFYQHYSSLLESKPHSTRRDLDRQRQSFGGNRFRPPPPGGSSRVIRSLMKLAAFAAFALWVARAWRAARPFRFASKNMAMHHFGFPTKRLFAPSRETLS